MNNYIERRCGYCNEILKRKEKESNYDFLKRRFCSNACSNRRQKQSEKCIICGEDGPFVKSSKKRSGRTSVCVKCNNEKSEQWRKANPERNKAAMKKWYLNNKEYVSKKGKDYYIGTIKPQKLALKKDHFDIYYESWRKKYIKYTYRISFDDFKRILKEQDGKCFICKVIFDVHMLPNIDHEHFTGFVRGILCANYNQGLGYALDNLLILKSSIEYLSNDLEVPSGQLINSEFYLKHYYTRYKLTKSKFLDLICYQDFKCAICKEIFDSEHKSKLHVDHCHITEKVRGLLCSQCNKMLGCFKDDKEIVSSALQYLVWYSGPPLITCSDDDRIIDD